MTEVQDAAGAPTAFGTLHARSSPVTVLVEVLHPRDEPGAYDRLVAAERELLQVQGRHVVRVLEVVRAAAGLRAGARTGRRAVARAPAGLGAAAGVTRRCRPSPAPRTVADDPERARAPDQHEP